MEVKKTKLLLAILLLAAPLFLAGCYVPFLNKEITIPFLEKKPQTAWDLMVKKMEQARNYKREDQLKMVVDINFPSQGAAAKEMSIIRGKSQAIIDLDVNSAIGINKIGSQISIDASLKKKSGFFLQLVKSLIEFKEAKQAKQTDIYLRINKIEGIIPSPIKQRILGKWYRIVNKKEKDSKKGIKFNQFLSILQKDHVFQVTKRLRDQKIDGHNCYH